MTTYTNGPGSDVITGTSDSDQFYLDFNAVYTDNTPSDNDTLYGGGGLDIFDATLGTDFIDGGAQDDIFDFSNSFSYKLASNNIQVGLFAYNVKLNIANGTYEIEWGYELGDEVIIATTTTGTFASVERFIGGKGKDIFKGSASDDVFYLSGGGGKYTGGAGDDFLALYTYRVGDVVRDGLFINAAKGKFTFLDNSKGTFSSIEGFQLSNGDDVFRGSGEDEDVQPLGGADSLDGRGGYDYLNYKYTQLANVDLSAGTAVVTGYAFLGSGSVTSTQSITNFEGVTGSSGNDMLTGSSEGNGLFGADGDDTINGKGGDDLILGDNGNDILKGGGGDDTIIGGRAKIDGSTGSFQFYSGSGADTIFGGNGNDEILSGDGKDKVFGGSGKDEIDGGAGHDILNGGSGKDTIKGEGGKDTLDGGGGNDTLKGGGGADTLLGSGGNDTLYGGDDNDRLKGGSGMDRLDGGKGDDILFGGMDADIFVLNRGHDILKDFETTHDKIDVSSIQGLKYDDFAALALDVVDITANDTVIKVNNNTTLTLIGVKFEDLVSENFIYPDDL